MVAEKPMGMFSAAAAEKYGTVFWLTPDGREVEITAQQKPSDYKWPDATVVGEVTKYVRRGREGTAPREERRWR